MLKTGALCKAAPLVRSTVGDESNVAGAML